MHDFDEYASVVEEGQTLHELQQLYRYGHNQVPVRRDNKLVAANFTNIEGYELISPAFIRPETVSKGFRGGTEAPTSDAAFDHFLKSLASKNDWITYRVADFVSEEGRSLPYLLLSSSRQCSQKSMDDVKKLRVWIQGAVHGNEPAGDQAILALLGKMDANETWTNSILNVMDIFVLPRFNPDGVAYFQRALASNLDGNRDHIKLASQQSRDIKSLFNHFAPHIAIDMHEFSAPHQYGDRYVHASDALFSAAKNLNINSNIREMSEQLFATNIGTALEGVALRWKQYITGSTVGPTIQFAEASSDAKIGRNAMGLTQAIAFLCETRGIGLGEQHFQRRTTAALVMAESIIQTAIDNAEQVYQTVEGGIEDFIKSSEKIVVTDLPTHSDRTFHMIDVKSGSIFDVPVRFAGTTPTTASLTRTRPEKYLIPRAWEDVATRLEICGLVVERLVTGFRGNVEALNITSVSFDETYYEGVVPVTITTTSTLKEVQLPSGSFAISTRQRNAALAFVALEPENLDSYVASNIIPVLEGDEYPIYRFMG